MGELNTYSVVVHCPRTRQLGMAVSSAVPAVGAVCLYGKAGVGVVSTQSWTNPYLAIQALDLMSDGASAAQALDAVLQNDAQQHLRQIGLVDAQGVSASWTGNQCTDWAGHIIGDHFAVQGNMLSAEQVIIDMAQALNDDLSLDLPERLMLALEAGQAAGGDKRGKQSAAICVYGDESYPCVDLRVDEHAEPILELRRVLDTARVQLFPFVESMPKAGQSEAALSESVSRVLLLPPAQRPGTPPPGLDPYVDLLGAELDRERLQADLDAFSAVLMEIKKLRGLDLSDVHPAVVFSPDELTGVRT